MSNKARILKLKSVISSDDEEDDYDQEDSNVDLELSMDKLNLGPKKKLLILCLGGLLVHRVHRREPKPPIRCDAVVGNFNIYKRPFCTEFLAFCLERFEVGIWSTAIERNVDLALGTLMRGLKGKLLFIWNQEECTDSGFKCLEKKQKPIFLKELRKGWEMYAFKKYSSSNTLMVDDEPYKALLNPANTAIFPTTFKAGKGNDTVLAPEGEMWKFLDGIADADDVRSYVKEHRIGQQEVTESHPDWDYYSKISTSFN